MRITKKQKIALEKITGKPWERWNPEAIRAYFAFTDRGELVAVSDEAKPDYEKLVECHRQHPVIVEMWKKDFCSGLLFLWDFFLPEIDYEKWQRVGFSGEPPTYMHPDAYIKHAFEIYKEARGYIPIDDVSGCKEWAAKLGIEI